MEVLTILNAVEQTGSKLDTVQSHLSSSVSSSTDDNNNKNLPELLLNMLENAANTNDSFNDPLITNLNKCGIENEKGEEIFFVFPMSENPLVENNEDLEDDIEAILKSIQDEQGIYELLENINEMNKTNEEMKKTLKDITKLLKAS